MGRWGDAFHALIQARDTADTADTACPTPASQQGSVCSGMHGHDRADAGNALIHSSDTADTADTSPDQAGVGPGSVTSVSSVTPCDRRDSRPVLLPVHLLSPVSAVSRPTEMPFAERTPQYEAIVYRGLAGTGYPRATLQRPVSWTDQAAHPEQGCFCSCCKGRRWWSDGRGWRCWACHPPDHLPKNAVTEVRT